MAEYFYGSVSSHVISIIHVENYQFYLRIESYFSAFH